MARQRAHRRALDNDKERGEDCWLSSSCSAKMAGRLLLLLAAVRAPEAPFDARNIPTAFLREDPFLPTAQEDRRTPFQLAPPTLLHATSTSISVAWVPPIEDGGVIVLGYALHGGPIGGPLRPLYDPLAAGQPPDPLRRSYSVHGLWPGTQYRFSVAATNGNGRGEFSDFRHFETLPVTPAISSAVPLAGPSRGGTRVRVLGADLAFASEGLPAAKAATVFKCRFGETMVDATVMERSLPARLTIDGYHGTIGGATAVGAVADADERVRQSGSPDLYPPGGAGDGSGTDGRAAIECYSPRIQLPEAFRATGEPLRLSALEVPLTVSSDGFHYAVSPLLFTVYEQLTPDVVSPASGPLVGGTAVTISGAFPRLDQALFASSAQAATFPEAACNFAGACRLEDP